jgi:hypothetical protein
VTGQIFLFFALGAIAGATAVVALVALRHFGRRSRQDLSRTIDEAERRASDILELAAELRRAADALVGDLDARAERLEALIARAEELETASSRPEPEDGPDAAPASAPAPDAERLADEREAGNPVGEIYELADRGLDPAAIARATERQLGEVELVLGLRDRRGRGRPSGGGAGGRGS